MKFPEFSTYKIGFLIFFLSSWVGVGLLFNFIQLNSVVVTNVNYVDVNGLKTEQSVPVILQDCSLQNGKQSCHDRIGITANPWYIAGMFLGVLGIIFYDKITSKKTRVVKKKELLKIMRNYYETTDGSVQEFKNKGISGQIKYSLTYCLSELHPVGIMEVFIPGQTEKRYAIVDIRIGAVNILISSLDTLEAQLRKFNCKSIIEVGQKLVGSLELSDDEVMA